MIISDFIIFFSFFFSLNFHNLTSSSKTNNLKTFVKKNNSDKSFVKLIHKSGNYNFFSFFKGNAANQEIITIRIVTRGIRIIAVLERRIWEARDTVKHVKTEARLQIVKKGKQNDNWTEWGRKQALTV